MAMSTALPAALVATTLPLRSSTFLIGPSLSTMIFVAVVASTPSWNSSAMMRRSSRPAFWIAIGERRIGEVADFELVVGERRDHRRRAGEAHRLEHVGLAEMLGQVLLLEPIEAQLATGATQATRIFTGSALAPRRRAAAEPATQPVDCAHRLILPDLHGLAAYWPSLAARSAPIVGANGRSQRKSIGCRTDTLQAVARLGGFLVPDQQPPAQQRHGLDQAVADDGDLDDAGEHAGRIGEARGASSWRRRGRSRPSPFRPRPRRSARSAAPPAARSGSAAAPPAARSATAVRARSRPCCAPTRSAPSRRPRCRRCVAVITGKIASNTIMEILETSKTPSHSIIDRQERDLRHRKADRDDRIEEPAHQLRCATSRRRAAMPPTAAMRNPTRARYSVRPS